MLIEEIITKETDEIIKKLRIGYLDAGQEFTPHDEELFRSGVSFGLVALSKAISQSGFDVITSTSESEN